jgi:hypothetical protein
MASQIGQNYLALILEQANQAGKPAPVRQPSMGGRGGGGFQQVQDFGGQGVAQLNGGGQPAGGGQMPMPPMGGDLQSLDAKMALARANARPANSFGGVRARTRAPAEAMKAERAYREQMYQRHVDSTKAAVKLFTPIMGKEQAQRFGDMVIENPKLLETSLDKFFSATSPTTLQKQVEYVNTLAEGSPEKKLAMDILLKNNGTKVSVGADGTILLATDGAELPSRSTTVGKVEDTLLAAEDAIETLGYLKEDFNADFLGIEGAVKGTVGNFADWAGLPWFNDMKEFGAQREDFIAENRRFVDEYRRQVTGAQASQAELTRIEQRLMNAATQGAQSWMRMFNTIIREQNRKANRERRKLGLDMLPELDNLVFSEEDMGEAMNKSDNPDMPTWD